MEPTKIFANRNHMAKFICPKCHNAKIVDVSEYKDAKTAIKLRHTCSCGYTHSYLLERRKFYRKEVSLPGEYILKGENTKNPMNVKDLSRSGLKLEVERNLKAGDIIFVEFRLDNRQKTLIQKEVVVRIVSGNNIGVEFTSRDPKNPIDKAYDIALGFYTFGK